METQKLAHLLAVIENGSFSAAAQAVHLTQSALSRSIQALERELGVPLFDRSAHRVHLTVYGKAVAQRARRLRVEESELMRSLKQLRGGHEGSLAIGLAPAPATLLLPSFLAHMARTRPAVRVYTEVRSTQEMIASLRAERLDAIVGDAYVLQACDDLELTVLGSLPPALVCRAGHPILRQTPIEFDALRKFPICSTTLSAHIARTLVEMYGSKARVSELVTVHCDNLDVLREVTLQTDSILLAVLAVTERERNSGLMAQLPVRLDPRLAGQYAIANLEARTPTPTLVELFEFASAGWSSA